MIKLIGTLLLATLLASGDAAAQSSTVNLQSLISGGDATTSGRIIQLILVITVLSVARLLADAIARIHTGQSLNDLFEEPPRAPRVSSAPPPPVVPAASGTR